MREKTSEELKKVNEVKWFQYGQHLYFSREGNPDIEISNIQEVSPKEPNHQFFQKIGNSFDIAYHDKEFVLCKNRDSLEKQAFVSLKTIALGSGICTKIPSRQTFIINNQIVSNIIQKENEATNLLTQALKHK